MLEEIAPLKSARILPLFLHPEIPFWMENQILIKRFYNFRSVCKLLVRKNAYGFMDIGNKLSVEKAGNVTFESRFFPVVINDEQKFFSEKTTSSDINIGWLGRLDKDKIYSVINFLDVISASEKYKNITLHLIGNGNGVNVIDFGKYAPNIKIAFNSSLFNEQKDEYITKYFDVAIAMGMSALDTALLGIPTVLPIVSSKPFNDNKFLYIFDTIDYCLGFKQQDLIASNCTTHTAENILDDIYERNKKNELGRACFNFVENTFSLENNIPSIVNMIEGSNLTVGRLLMEPSFFMQRLLFRIYRIYRPNATYDTFMLFKDKFRHLRKQPLKQQMSTIIKKLTSLYKVKH